MVAVWNRLKTTDVKLNSSVKSHQKTLKAGIHSFPAWCSTQKGLRGEKSGSLLVFLDKTLNDMHPSLCSRQVPGPSSVLVVVAQPD